MLKKLGTALLVGIPAWMLVLAVIAVVAFAPGNRYEVVDNGQLMTVRADMNSKTIEFSRSFPTVSRLFEENGELHKQVTAYFPRGIARIMVGPSESDRNIWQDQFGKHWF